MRYLRSCVHKLQSISIILSYVLNKFLPLDDRSTTWPTLDFGQPAHLSMLLLILTKDLKRASASYLALWATLMVDCVVLSLY